MAFGSVKSAIASTRSSVSSRASSVYSFESSEYNNHVSSTQSDKRNRAVNPSGMEIDIPHLQDYSEKYVKPGQDYSPRSVTLNSRYSNLSGLPVDAEYVQDYSQKWKRQGSVQSTKPAKKNNVYPLSMEMTPEQLAKYNRKYGKK